MSLFKRRSAMREHQVAIVGAVLILGLMTFSGCNNKVTTPQGNADVTIEIQSRNGSNSYSPNPATVAVGQKVAWHNADNMTHTATGNGGQFNTGDIAPGKTSAIVTFSTAGTINYHCSLHPDMTGTLTITS
jgi:plastocyanin